MGTRNLILVKYNQEYKVAQYSQWDGYPSGEGFNVVKFLTQPNLNINLFKEKINNITHWGKEGLQLFESYILAGFNGVNEHPELSRDLGSEILDYIYKDLVNKVNFDINFAANSLFCEWAWCINLDTNCLDCFKGWQTEPLDKDQPFYYLQDKMMPEEGYYPIKLICSIPFNELSKFNTKYDFEGYIDDIISMSDKPIMDNGIPKIWEENI
jgi:hypothetical protein